MWQVFAARISVDLENSYPRAKRIILRDVSRTDRNYHFFRCVCTPACMYAAGSRDFSREDPH